MKSRGSSRSESAKTLNVIDDKDLIRRINELEKEVIRKSGRPNTNVVLNSEINTLKTKLARMQRENDILTQQSKSANGTMLHTVQAQRKEIDHLQKEIELLEKTKPIENKNGM
jgi:transposase-like protein